MRPSAPAAVAILLVRGSGGPSGIEPMGPAHAAGAFQVLWAWGDGWTAGHGAIVRALLAEGAARLHMNGTPEEAGELLAGWLDR